MALSKEQVLLLADRRKRVADSYLRGRPQYLIAQDEKVNPGTITRDLEHVKQQWQAASIQAIDARKAQELAKIDHLEAVAWEAWDESRKDAEILQANTTKGRVAKDGIPLPDLQKTSKVVKRQHGDPRFLERVSWCVQKRCEILGIMKPEGPISNTIVTVVGGIDMQVVAGVKVPMPLQIPDEQITIESVDAETIE